jgi:hypothetical protein
MYKIETENGGAISYETPQYCIDCGALAPREQPYRHVLLCSACYRIDMVEAADDNEK